MSKVYTEDIKAAINLAKQLPNTVVSNIFRFTPNQHNALVKGIVAGTSSINTPSNRKSLAPVKVTPRMTEVAATLRLLGYKTNDIAEIFGVDSTTISKKLTSYHGYVKTFKI